MTKAAGILFLTPDKQALFLKRSETSDFPGFWCFPGGTSESDETPEQTAVRECVEEVGHCPYGKRGIWLTTTSALTPDAPSSPTEFTTFLQRIDAPFEPTLNDEHTGYAWADIATPPEPLHPGCRVALDKFSMNEMQAAKAIAAGIMNSPQMFSGFALWAIRITSTGTAYRAALDEMAYRDPAIWLTPETLERVAALPVIIDHPEGNLNSQEFASRTVGTVQYAYIADASGVQNIDGPDIWAVVRIYDTDTINFLAKNQWSTSPSVHFGSQDLGEKITLENGKTVLVEGNPQLMCHIALVKNGVWDRQNGPSGVRTDSQNASRKDKAAMTEEEKKAAEAAAADKARRDAEGETIDRVLKHLDAMSKRMDAMEADRKREDAQRRMDAERAEWEREDAASCARDDAEEAVERKKYCDEGMDETAAMDKARSSRRDRMKARRDAAETDEKKAEREAAAKKEREDAARRDADLSDLRARAEAISKDRDKFAHALAHVPMPYTDANYAIMADTQAVYDAPYQALGQRCPPPHMYEEPMGYRVRCARGLQGHSKAWKAVDLAALQEPALVVAEGQIRADAIIASRSTSDMPEGAMIPRQRTLDSGHHVTEWVGRTTIFKAFAPPSMRAIRFNTERRA